MKHFLHMQGQLIVETSHPVAKMDFQGEDIFLSLDDDIIDSVSWKFGALNIRKMCLPAGRSLYNLGMTIKINCNDELVATVGKKAKPSKFMSVFAGKHVQINDIRKCIKIVRKIASQQNCFSTRNCTILL